jgi:hypothetical protein
MISQERNEDLSIYYWLKDTFPAFVTIQDGFPDAKLVIPTVSVEWDEITGYDFELGNRTPLKERLWYLDIFAKNKSQRDDFAYLLFNELDDGIPVYDYNDGFPSTTRLGTLIPVQRRIKNLHSFQEDEENPTELYYRAVVIFTATYDATS